MTTETEETVDIETNLDDFSKEFFQAPNFSKAKEEVKEEKEEEVAETEDDSLATEETADDADEDEESDDEPDEDESEEESEEEEIEEVPAPKAKRNKTQERIEKLVAEARTAERERDLLRREIEALKAETTKEAKTEAEPVKGTLSPDAPKFDAVDKDGEPVYPLGEFDPQYIADLTRHTIAQEMKAAKEKAELEARVKATEQARQEITDKWVERVEAYEKEVPELRENIIHLTDTFQNVEPQYGEFLAAAIMSNEHGPQIMNYLSQNIDEARKIVASGPVAAMQSLGRLEALLSNSSKASAGNESKPKKQTQAPPPPLQASKGRGAKVVIPVDTDKLDDFEKLFYQK